MSVTLFLIRHASSGNRNNFDPLDYQRPLDTLGKEQAEAVSTKLRERNIDSIYSSKATRCVETVEPLAQHFGITIEIEDALFEGSSSSAAITLVRTLAEREVDGDVVLCSHGDVIPDILRVLATGGTRLHGSGCAKGSIWALDTAGERIDTGHYYNAQQILDAKNEPI